MDMYVKLKLKCLQWRKSPEVFSEIVLFVLQAQPEGMRRWADEFECSVPTLQRWAHGSHKPPALTQRYVVNRFLAEANRNILLDLLKTSE
jgi:hypothetical protein